MEQLNNPDAPINESGLTQMIMMGKSLRQKWINVSIIIEGVFFIKQYDIVPIIRWLQKN